MHRLRRPPLIVLAVAVLATASCGSDDAPVAPPTTNAAATSDPVVDDPTTTATATTTTTIAGTEAAPDTSVRFGIDRLTEADFAQIGEGTRVGLITNQVSTVGQRHLIDVMHDSTNVDLVRIFAAEHGVRGVTGAGEPIGDGVDADTGVPITSLYGDIRQPTPEMLDGIDTIVFDLQDVGTRYYTYTATMGLAMQSAALAEVAFVVLDRPNPLGRLVEGDLRDDDQLSFISQYPTPSVHGLTAGELARMIVGEAWLPIVRSLDLQVIEMTGWSGRPWLDSDLAWTPPSPGLQTVEAATTYPAIVWFEATGLSYGAGTELAFRAVGAPWLDAEAVVADLGRRRLPGVEFRVSELAPTDIENVATDPRFEDEVLPGVELVITDVDTFRPSATGLHLLEAVMGSAPERQVIDRPAVFDLLAGTASVRRALEAGSPVEEIVADWERVAAEFEARAFPYLLYP
jgi:uncharacterized protein YbbC (DUF1343 family)